jgi:hypothetical protein
MESIHRTVSVHAEDVVCNELLNATEPFTGPDVATVVSSFQRSSCTFSLPFDTEHKGLLVLQSGYRSSEKYVPPGNLDTMMQTGSTPKFHGRF